jgi:hypothetical protein
MNRRSLSSNWTEEDRHTSAQWMRAMAALYGCIALLVFGFIVLTRQSSLAPNEASERQTWSTGLQAERANPGADLSVKAQ